MAGFGFNLNDYATATSNFDPLPAGDYKLRIMDSEIKTSAKGNDYLSISFQVSEGEFSNRMIWSNFNIMHPNEDTRRIAREQLTALCAAAGCLGANDSSQLHGRVVIGKVKCDPASDFPNSIKGYKSAGNVQPALKSAPVGQAAAAQSSVASRSKSWEKAS